MAKAVFCLVDNTAQAEKIVDDLKKNGITNSDISILFPDRGTTRDFSIEKQTKAPEGYSAGVGVGGAIGGVLGWLAGIGALAIPGIGPFIAAGPIMAALSGAAIGAAAMGILGALVGMGMPEHVATLYESKIKEGHILMAVHSEDSERTNLVKNIYEKDGGHEISTGGESRAASIAEKVRNKLTSSDEDQATGTSGHGQSL